MCGAEGEVGGKEERVINILSFALLLDPAIAILHSLAVRKCS